jgi:predicted nucleotidyltransferase
MLTYHVGTFSKYTPKQVIIDYDELKLQRNFKKFPRVIDKLKNIIAYLIELYPSINQIHLHGSYAKGSWIDNKTSPEFIKIRKEYKNVKKLKFSDFDLVIQCPVNIPKINLIYGEKVDVVSEFLSENNIMIYNNGKILI